MKPIYADYAAATPTNHLVAQIVERFSLEVFANPSSAHAFGTTAQMEIEKARQTIAAFINAKPSEIFFTATGTESNNLAILGVAKANKQKGRQIMTTAIEHPSIMNASQALVKDGWKVNYLPVDKNGQISLDKLEPAITQETVLFSIHFGNSELGTLPEVAKISEICQRSKVLLHVDACQAMAYEPIDVQALNIDLLTFNGSKMYGPKGVAVLYVRENTSIFPIIYGGGQEQSLRSGTENGPGIVGLAKAVQIVSQRREKDSARIGRLRDWLQKELEKAGQIINAKSAPRLPNHLSVRLSQSNETDLVRALDEQRVAVSSGSACSSRSQTDSHVLIAIGLTSEQINQTIRISLGRLTTKDDCQKILKAIRAIS